VSNEHVHPLFAGILERTAHKNGSPTTPVGDLHDKDTLFLGIYAGRVGNGEGGEELYLLTVQASGYAPIVRSAKSGRSFTLSWRQIIALAEAAGING